MPSLKRKLADFLLSRLFRLPCPVLTVVKNQKGKVVMAAIGDKMLTHDELTTYSGQAQVILAQPVMRLVLDRFRSDACRKIFDKSQNADDLLAQKTVLWTIDVIHSLLKDLTEVEVKRK